MSTQFMEVSKTPPQDYWGKHGNLRNVIHLNAEFKGSEVYISDSLMLSSQQRERGGKF